VPDPSTLRRWSRGMDSSQPARSFLHQTLARVAHWLGCGAPAGPQAEPFIGADPGSATSLASASLKNFSLPPTILAWQRCPLASSLVSGGENSAMGEDLEQLKQRFPLLDYLRQQNWIARPAGQGPEFVGLCPLHPESRPSFCVNARKNLFYCHGCGEGGDLIASSSCHSACPAAKASPTLNSRARRQARLPLWGRLPLSLVVTLVQRLRFFRSLGSAASRWPAPGPSQLQANSPSSTPRLPAPGLSFLGSLHPHRPAPVEALCTLPDYVG